MQSIEVQWNNPRSPYFSTDTYTLKPKYFTLKYVARVLDCPTMFFSRAYILGKKYLNIIIMDYVAYKYI